MIGHSVGEYVAACLGGVFTRDDALRLVAERARLMQALPEGTMLAVRATADDVRELLPDDLEIAAENAPNLTVVSGETAAIERFEARLAERDVAARRLATSHAFHSAMMDPILEEFAEVVASTPRSAPTLPWVSSLTGDWITHEQSQDSAYWVEQLRRPVLFAKGIARLLEDPARVTLEVGPGRQLTGLTKQACPEPPPRRRHARRRGRPVIVASPRGAALDRRRLPRLERASTRTAARRRVPLPTYPFERKRHWVDRAAGEPVGERSRPHCQPRSFTRMRCQSQATQPTRPQPDDETPWSTAYEACSPICRAWTRRASTPAQRFSSSASIRSSSPRRRSCCRRRST